MPAIEFISIALQILPAALLAAAGIMLLILICVQLIISISGMQQQIRKLSKELSLRQAMIESLIVLGGLDKESIRFQVPPRAPHRC